MATFVVVTPGFPTNEADTTCLPAFQQFALSLKKVYPQHEFIILSFQYPFEKKEYSWHGLQVFSLGGSNKPGLSRFLTWVKAYRCLQKIHKQKIIKGMISLWLTECSLVAKYFAKLNHLKHFMWLIGQDAKTTNQYIRRIKPQGNSIIAMSDFLKEEYSRNHKEVPFLVAENGINTSSFPAMNTSKREIDVLGVGSLIPLKNYPLFIEIIFELKKVFPHIKAVIAGVGVEEEHLKKLVSKLHLEGNITFTGLIPHTQVFNLMNKSRIFLHTSNYEGNSTVLMEALYSGCFTFSTCPLSNRKTKHLTILKTKEAFVTALEKQLKDDHSKHERITFNTMDESAEKIMNLFLK